MAPALQVYLILVIVGLFLIGAEIFLPGGVIGAIGGIALIAAALVGFQAFGIQGGMLSSIAIIVLAGVCIVLWVKYFPKTRMGRHLTLQDDGKSFKAPDLKALAGKEGVALSTLRPAGIARIDGQRVDVVADGSWIDAGRAIRVVQVEGPRVMVREIAAPSPQGPAA